MKNLRLYVLVTFCVALSVQPAFGQRQTVGRHSLEAFGTLNGVSNALGRSVFTASGGGLQWGKYDYLGYVFAGAQACRGPLSLTESAITDSEGTLIAPESKHYFNYVDVAAYGGYALRVWAPRSRVVVLSAGLAGCVGIRNCGPMGGYVKVYDTSGRGEDVYYIKTGFLMQVMPVVAFEAFPFRNISFAVSYRPLMDVVSGLGGSYSWFHSVGSLSVKYYF